MNPSSWEEFSDFFLLIYKGPSHSQRTLSKMRHVLHLVGELGVTRLDQLTTELAARFVIERSKQVCANTIRGEISYLKAACNYAVDEGWLDRAPKWRRIMPRKSLRRRKTLHRLEEIRWVLARLKARLSTWEGGRLYALAALV